MQAQKTIWHRLTALYVALFIAAPILSNWTLEVGGFKVLYGVLAMTLAYGVKDVIQQLAGTSAARRTILWAAGARAAFWALTIPVVLLYPHLRDLLFTSFGILLTGEIAMVGSQYFIDIPIFARLKHKFWLRYNLSNFISMPISVGIFTAGVCILKGLPFLPLMVGNLSARMFILPLLLTPLFSLIARYGDRDNR